MWTAPEKAKAPTVLMGALLTAATSLAGWVGAITHFAGSCISSAFVAACHGGPAAIPRQFGGDLTANARHDFPDRTILIYQRGGVDFPHDGSDADPLPHPRPPV